MPTIQVEEQSSLEALAQAIGRLSLHELEALEARVRQMIAQRRAPSSQAQLPAQHEEARLLLAIKEAPSEMAQRRFDDLMVKRMAETLTPEEHGELVELTTRREAIWARRLAAAAELARLRGISLEAIENEFQMVPAIGERPVV